ncbi:universal stress protein [Pyrodictium delaneyi]|uniref:Universal stress protein n=2 Tax=Pyrodictium delaneyi TaxID=1273541 RepID=A0A0P0N5J8_9CREN|nr:universal stress protein [Pyrodictium delaneyi]ALL01715.1 universal stress protein [Pyrodictium delaneyi]
MTAAMDMKFEPTYRISFLFRRILVPVDGSESSLRALDIALDFAQRYGSRVTVLHVHAPGEDPKPIENAIRKRIEGRGLNVTIKTREYKPHASSIASEILSEVVEGGYDLIVLGARGSTANEDLMIGSVALSIVVNSATSVMVVR